MFSSDPRMAMSKLSSGDSVLFLDFDGPMHPDAVFRTKHGMELRAPGRLFMHAPLLVDILKAFPEVKISLSTSWSRTLGFRRARACLPAELQARTISSTWHSKMPRRPHQGYDTASRFEQIAAAVATAGLTRWVALDDDPLRSWPDSTPEKSHLVRCDSLAGLSESRVQHELMLKLQALR